MNIRLYTDQKGGKVVGFMGFMRSGEAKVTEIHTQILAPNLWALQVDDKLRIGKTGDGTKPQQVTKCLRVTERLNRCYYWSKQRYKCNYAVE